MSIASVFSRSVIYPRLSEKLASIEIPYLFSNVAVQNSVHEFSKSFGN
jgi:hypothetical protein